MSNEFSYKWLNSLYEEYPEKFVWTGLLWIYYDTNNIGWPIHGPIPTHVFDEWLALFELMLIKYTRQVDDL